MSTRRNLVRFFAPGADHRCKRSNVQQEDWLRGLGITVVAMESTGVYWHPIFNILEEGRTIILVNAQHMKAVPGRKTDTKLRHEVA